MTKDQTKTELREEIARLAAENEQLTQMIADIEGRFAHADHLEPKWWARTRGYRAQIAAQQETIERARKIAAYLASHDRASRPFVVAGKLVTAAIDDKPQQLTATLRSTYEHALGG